MSCYHRYPHGCDWPVVPPDWYDAYGHRPRRYRDEVVVLRDEDDDIEDVRLRRRRGRRRQEAMETTEKISAATLQARAEALRDELTRIEEDLAQLVAEPGPASEA